MKRGSLSLALLIAVGCDAPGSSEEQIRAIAESFGVYSPRRLRDDSSPVGQLGQLLFFEREVSGNRNIACSSCHFPADNAQDGLPVGRGEGASGLGRERVGGRLLRRNTLAPFNPSVLDTMMWDGRLERLADGTIRAPVPLPEGIATLLEAQALLPLLDRVEMRGEPGSVDVRGRPNELAQIADEAPSAVWSAIMARLMAIDLYRALFAAAFPEVAEGEHTIVHFARAIARFEMMIWDLTDTHFDRLLRAEIGSFEARDGAALFFGEAGCAECHNGPLLSDARFYDLGIEGDDLGRAEVTGDSADRNAFRTSPLRNVALTAPYLHDGSAPTLDAAIRAHPGEPANVEALVGFLNTLTSSTELSVPFNAGVPARVPSGLDVDARE